ncbi:hypothetical protein LNO81_27360 [Klebsiella variicola subsp. variicola]|nr:hypothetical protein [Klebsiella variicola subsp. variicola]
MIHDAMRFFLRHQPENMTLVVLSRNLPQLGIANLRVRDQLLEIGSQQLAFTHQEAKQFFDCRLTSPIEADDSSRLCDDVAGWATALQLIALSARQNNSSAQHSARRLAGINASHLSDYLVDEVLDNVDARTRNFFAEEFSATLDERRVNRARHRRREWPDAAGGDRTPGAIPAADG